MNINSFEELVMLASTKENDLDKLKVLEQYFLDNVEFNYAKELGQAEVFHPELLSIDYKKDFLTLDEKLEKIDKFEKRFGENFHFSKKMKSRILSYLGKVVEPYKEKHIVNGKEYYSNHSGFDGSILSAIKRIPIVPVYNNDLIIEGVCSDFSPFAKKFCDYLGIESSIYGTTDGHVFLVCNINGEKRIFDFTRIVGIRDGYMNPDNQQIEDWFNMSFEKMFEYKPNREINSIDGNMLSIPITKDNYTDYGNQRGRSV